MHLIEKNRSYFFSVPLFSFKIRKKNKNYYDISLENCCMYYQIVLIDSIQCE